jgi:hypothetical protein
MERKPVVHSDHEIMSGIPVFSGTRVPFSTFFEYLEAGDPLDVFLEHFPSVSVAKPSRRGSSRDRCSRPVRLLLDERIPRPLGRHLVRVSP